MSPASRKILIVNADDLGRTSGINSGIFEAHRTGLVSSATLMVGYPAAREAAARLGEYPDLGVGLHVALTGQAPLLPTHRVPSLVDQAGRFPAKPDGYSEIDEEEVLAEASAQLDRFQHLTGRLPTHLDSHHHSHRHPLICNALIAMATEYDLPVRNSSPSVGQRLREQGVATTDGFVEHFFGEGACLTTLLEILGNVQDGTTELMCHPAYVDTELRKTSSYADDRLRELEILTHGDALLAVQRLDLRLRHFGNLGEN